jgi:hypothetical protein
MLLSFALEWKNKDLFINQSQYSEKLLEIKYSMERTKYRTPAETDIDWGKRKEDEEPADPNTYRALIGGLLWLALGTRPDILFSVIALSQHATNLARRHRKALDHICGYLRKTQEMGLYYTYFENAHAKVYTDAA